MFKRPINDMLTSSLESLSNMIDSSKIIGKPIDVGDDKFIIPISKVTLGFGMGGSEFSVKKDDKKKNNELSFEINDDGINIVRFDFICVLKIQLLLFSIFFSKLITSFSL